MRNLKAHFLRAVAAPFRIVSAITSPITDFSDQAANALHDPHTKNDTDDERTAYHEAGHAVLLTVLEGLPAVDHISIEQKGNLGGYVAHPPIAFHRMTRDIVIKEMAALYGGLIAERQKFNEHRAGVVGDITELTQLADLAIDKLGMSNLPRMDYDPQPTLINRIFSRSSSTNMLPESVKSQLHAEKTKLLLEAEELAEKTLNQYWGAVEDIAAHLKEHKGMDGQGARKIIHKRYPHATINMPLQEPKNRIKPLL